MTIPRFWASLFLLCATIAILAADAMPASAAQATLAWDPVQEGEIEGYGIYYSSGSDGPPYELFGYVTIAELSDANAPSATITGFRVGQSIIFL